MVSKECNLNLMMIELYKRLWQIDVILMLFKEKYTHYKNRYHDSIEQSNTFNKSNSTVLYMK